MSAIDECFRKLRAAKRKALMPFVTAGDPQMEFTASLIKEMAARKCDLCEVGIPYSDPIADGPVIQESYTRALAHHVKLADIFAMLGQTTPKVAMPTVTMVSYAIVYRHGIGQYVDDAKAAGVAGLIVPDLPVEESPALADVCRKADLSLVQLVTPTTTPERVRRIIDACTGFIYYVSVVGITGERTQLPPELVDNVARLREQTPLPICIGFGISTPEHIRRLKPVADGFIVGSAIVRRVAECATRNQSDVLADVGVYMSTLRAALDEPS
ncbi:MAG: tryptophan synthase subunit alpha [Planctomycetia bacterium]|nr:tryptophan synthase subunit alpha [Planctomycetia bacterium]